MNRFLTVVHVLGPVIVIFALTMLLPLAIAFLGHDDAVFAYDESILITMAAGGLLWLATRRHKRELQVRDGFLLVVLVWLGLPLFAALPLLFYLPAISFTDAYFETVSAMTTTGATVLEGLDRLPPSINVWRGELQWLGGMGIIVLAVAILPLLGVGGSQMYRAETPGPMKDTKLTPRITETAKGLWLVYAVITVACILAYRLAGMSWLDALVHSFSTMSLGGFSTHDASYGYFNSATIEVVTILFMLVAGMNFGTHFLAFRQRGISPYRHDPEAKLFLLVTSASCVGLAVYLYVKGSYPDFWTALRFAGFNTVSIATTTGYANTDFNLWPIFAPLWMLFLSSFASSSGSTGGGIKMIRAILLYKQVFREMLKIMHPQVIAPVKLGGQPVPNNIIFAVLAFIFIWMVSLVTATLLLTASGLDIVSSFTAAVACITNTGPGLNDVGPATTFTSLTDFQTWVCAFVMVLGRLELFTLLVVLTPQFWQR